MRATGDKLSTRVGACGKKIENVFKPNLFSALEFERGAFENSDGVVLGGRDDAEWTRGAEVHRVDRLRLTADLTNRGTCLRHEHVTEPVTRKQSQI